MKKLLFILLNWVCYTAVARVPFVKQIWVQEQDVPLSVNDMAYQQNGYMWLATDAGLYRYNGRTFSRIHDTISSFCTAVHANGNNIFVGYKDGRVGLVTEQKITPVLFKNSAPHSTIKALRSLSETVLFIATEDEGLYISFNGYLMPVNTDNGLSDNFISDIAIGKNDLLLATDAGINRISMDNKKPALRFLTTRDKLPDNIVTCISASLHSEMYWAGTQQSGIALYDDSQQSAVPLRYNTPWTFGQVNDILALNDEDAWAITEEGYILQLHRVRERIFIRATATNNKLKKLVKDKTGNLWCATNKGLLLCTGLFVEHISLSREYKLNDYTAMTCDTSGNIWFTQNEKLYRLNHFTDTLPQFIGSLPVAITALYFCPRSGLWIGSFGKGLYRLTENRLTPVGIPSLTGAHILSVTNRGESIWVASFNGLDEIRIMEERPQIVHHYTKQNGIGSDYIYHLHTDRKDRLWMATDGGGLIWYDGSHFHKWDTTAGLKSTVFYSVATDGQGNVWSGSFDKGLYKYDGIQWKAMRQKEGLQDINITALATNGAGSVIVVNRSGIDQWYARDHQFRHFNRRLAIGIDSSSKMLNCIASDASGNVYAPYQEGILVFKSQSGVNSIKPDIYIRKQSLFFKELSNTKHTFSHGENHISFSYDGVSYSNPDRLHYRYKLVGYDDSWVYTNNETIPFAQLNPGSYTFRVQVSLSDNFMNASEDSYSFYITKPFWGTPWFVIGCLITVLTGIYFFVKWRENGIVKLNQLQRDRLVYEYEHLKSQVNPHFLFNSFNTLVNIIEEDKDAAIHYTVHLSDLYRNMLSYKDKDLISLKEEYDIVQNYMFVQKSRFGDALHVHVNISEILLRTKKIVPLALQILLENAIKHNIVSLSNPLHIYLEATENEIVVRNNLQEKITKDKSTGIGIENIRKRYELLTQKTISYGVINKEYIVKLPLL
ncbi:MAG TPA: histidine kinase [Flavipsychrobacter sp.]|nr:histidine kinase [Flavipsychrobacter sp.]